MRITRNKKNPVYILVHNKDMNDLHIKPSDVIDQDRHLHVMET